MECLIELKIFFFCRFIDPWWMSDSIERTNEHNGGLNPRAYRILMTQGELDPYRTLGPARNLNAQAPVIIINCKPKL
jgi:Serine carboxypeptidase S28